jgi:hypothetical protein
MPDSPLSVRKEIHDYLRCSEYLLSNFLTPDDTPLSQQEEDIVEYYAVELLKLTPRARPVPKYRRSVHEYVSLSEALLKLDDFTPQEKEVTQSMLKRLSEKLLVDLNECKP